MAIITITRGSLSASQKLTNRLAKVLHCRAISTADIVEHGKKYGIDEFLQVAKRIMETKPPHSWDPQSGQIHNYLTIFKAALLDFVTDGNVIYHGLQMHFLLTDIPRILKIKVIAPLEYRVKTLIEETSLTADQAREQIQHMDSQRLSWAKFLYGKEFDEPTTYDMILNMSNLNLDAITELVALVIRRQEFQLHGGVMKEIRNAHLRALVMAHLVRSSATRGIDFSVKCDSESGYVKIQIGSPAPATDDWQKNIREAVAGIENISSLEITPFK